MQLDNLLQDPYTKHLAKFCKKKYYIHKKLKYNDILSIINISDTFKDFSIQACVTQTTINNKNVNELVEKLKWIIHNEKESNHLIIIFQFISNIIQYLELDIDFRKASNYFQKDLMHPILSIPSCIPFIINKNYTDLLMNAIHIDIMTLNDGETPLDVVQSFIANLELTIEDIRKEYYADLSKKIKPFKKELVTAVMHPLKFQKMLDSGMELDEVIAIYSV